MEDELIECPECGETSLKVKTTVTYFFEDEGEYLRNGDQVKSHDEKEIDAPKTVQGTKFTCTCCEHEFEPKLED